MIEVTDLPHVLAAVNVMTIATLLSGYVAIRQKRKETHMAFMKGALALGAAFLLIYGYYKLNSGFAKFGGEGSIRTVYFSILFAHVVLAAVSLLLVPFAIFRAFRGNFQGHKKIARWALPVWLIVATSGVIVYVMAVHIYPYTPPQ